MTEKKKNPDQAMAIVGLILNIAVFPGLGTVIGGGEKYKTTGILQLAISIVSIPLMFIIIGIPLFFGMWIWALITGVNMMRETTA